MENSQRTMQNMKMNKHKIGLTSESPKHVPIKKMINETPKEK
jgi:hypothetical protein